MKERIIDRMNKAMASADRLPLPGLSTEGVFTLGFEHDGASGGVLIKDGIILNVSYQC
jgi:hypothetical protein